MIFLFMKTQKRSLFSTKLPKTHLINFFYFFYLWFIKYILTETIFFKQFKKKSADNSTKGDTYTTCLVLQHTMSLIRKYIFLNQWRRSLDIDYQSWICNYMPLLI
jgi:hypothetical protein